MEEYEFDKSRIFHNAVLSYDGGADLRVLITDFSYSYSLTTNSATTRTFVATYPKWFRQSAPRVTIQFVNTEGLKEFVDWVGMWQAAAVGMKKGTCPIRMRGIGSLNSSVSGRVFDYTVLIKSARYNRNVSTNAPTATVDLVVLDDMWNRSYSTSQTSMSGNLAKNRDTWAFSADDVSDKGAFREEYDSLYATEG